MEKSWAAGALVASLMLGSCANMTPEDRDTAGTIVGGIVGGVVGSQVGGDKAAHIVGGVVGSLVGAYIGHEIAQYVNDEEAKEIEAAQRQALAQYPTQPSTATWESKDKKKKAVVTAKPKKTKKETVAEDKAKPESEIKNLSSDFDELPESTACRETTTTLDAKGKTVEDSGLYCQSQGGDYVRVADLDRA